MNGNTQRPRFVSKNGGTQTQAPTQPADSLQVILRVEHLRGHGVHRQCFGKKHPLPPHQNSKPVRVAERGEWIWEESEKIPRNQSKEVTIFT